MVEKEMARKRGRGAEASAHSEASERLKARLRGGRRSDADGYQIKLENPIYDTLTEDEYNALVAKRRREQSRDFIVEDDGLGYGDEAEEEEEDWSNAGFALSSDGSGGESKRKKVEKKDPQPKTSSVFKKSRDGKAKGFSCDSIVDGCAALGSEQNYGGVREEASAKESEGGEGFNSDPTNRNIVVGEKIMPKDTKIEAKPTGEKKVFTLNAKVKDDSKVANEALNIGKNLELNQDGSLSFYILDAHEEFYGPNMGDLYLFGKVKAGKSYQSCCVVVKNMQRCVYAIPNHPLHCTDEMMKLDKDVEESRISCTERHKKRQDMVFGLKNEIAKQLSLNVSTFSMESVKRKYAFERSEIPAGENYVLKINYPFKDPPLLVDLKGESFCALLGTHRSALELFLIKRKIKGPSWLLLSNFSTRLASQRVSWCKFEVIVESPKDISISKSSVEIPPVVATAVNLKTTINEKKSKNEVVSASIVCCREVKIDTPTLASEWKRPGMLTHFTVVRELDGGPLGFEKEVTDRNTRSGSNVLCYERSERALLNRLIIELHKLDSDVLVGHNISGFDLDVLLHRCQIWIRKALCRFNKTYQYIGPGELTEWILGGHLCALVRWVLRFDSGEPLHLTLLKSLMQALEVPISTWSKIGRLNRSIVPKLSRVSSVSGSGVTPRIMSCVAGRLLCDTYLCARDLLKEVSYSLTQLANTQLNKVRKEVAPNDVSKMFQSAESLMELIEYGETDAWLSMELMFHLSVLPLTLQLTNISGNLWGKTLQGARAQRVEYLLLHAFHKKKYIVPDKIPSHTKDTKLTKRRVTRGVDDGNLDEADIDNTNYDNDVPDSDHKKNKKGPSYAGGLVLEPKKGLYDKYILLLDFNSLYPSIIQFLDFCVSYLAIVQEYNICFTTVERSSDGSFPRLPSSKTTGVLPEVLKDLVDRRRRVKESMKGFDECLLQLDIRQQALKLTANSVYGCLGFSNSRFYAKPLAELITLQGREILQSTVDLVQNNLNLEVNLVHCFFKLLLQGVIYGDTDSIMIYSGLDDIEKAKAIAGKVIKEVNKKYRCLKIDLDGLYKRMLLLKKKKYAAVKVQFKDRTPYEVIERKGLDIVRRDWSPLSKDIGDFCLNQILSGGSCEDVVESIHSCLRKVQEEMRSGEVPLEKYIITKTLTKPPEAYPAAKNQPHVLVAQRLKQKGYSTGCSAGDTIPYIICCEQGSSSGSATGIAQRARYPEELKQEQGQWMIDIDYYLSQQIHPVVSRLCASIQGTSPARLADCLGLDASKFQHKSSEAFSGDPSSSLFFAAHDEKRYHGCEPLVLSCPSCSATFDCPSIFKSICSFRSEKPTSSGIDLNHDFWHKLRCPKCPEEDGLGRISPAMIANQVKRQADKFVSMYYKGLLMCDDETCNFATLSINLRLVGDAERGTVCPNYPRCNGHLQKKYTEADLYKQLSYFCHVLDTVSYVEKLEAKSRISVEKELAKIRAMVDLASSTVQKIRDRCSYGWVQLRDLVITV
ncbi:DNA polymerase alpha catalytic subunit [Senna tora]|uniref:DNA polymerase n=1 Tax=Senna tora TaxID=362788 RepID=A0A834STX7_9FABA|nr:DNA polymerase alpha catalytic subunit [Senna tora]